MTMLHSEKLSQEFEKIKTERDKAYQEQGIELDTLALDIERGHIIKQAIINAAIDSRAAGKAILEGLWEVYWNNYHRSIDEIETLTEWADTHLSNFIDHSYLMDLVRTVEQIFPQIMRWDMQGNPITDDNGEIVDIPYLINRVGPAKLKRINEFFSEKFVITQNSEPSSTEETTTDEVSIERDNPSEPVTKEEIQREAIKAATNLKRDDITSFKEQIKNGSNGNGNSKHHIPFKIVYREDKLYDIQAIGLTALQCMLLKKMLGEFFEEII